MSTAFSTPVLPSTCLRRWTGKLICGTGRPLCAAQRGRRVLILAPCASFDPYEELGVARTADAGEIKRAYRRAALERHPDVSKVPGAQEAFQRAQDAYRMLSDKGSRARYDRAAARESGSAGSAAGAGDGGAAAREYARRWREQNPMPEDLDDNLGSVLSDLFGAVRGAGQGAPSVLTDLLDFLEGRTGPPSGDAEATPADFALRSRVKEVVEAEIRDFARRHDAAQSRATGAENDAEALDARAKEWGRRARNMQQVADFAARDAARDMEQELTSQATRLRQRAKDSRAEGNAAAKIRDRLNARLQEIEKENKNTTDADRAAPKASRSREERERGKKKAVEDELERMKREMGL